MSKGLFITGTGTDVGKTYVTGLIVKKLREFGSCAYYKAAVSGNSRAYDLSLIPGDAVFVRKVSGISQSVKEMCPYIYENAVSPHLAARIEGNPVDLEKVKQGYEALEGYDYVTMEGSGGILCPIRLDDTELWLEDIVSDLNLPSLLIADAGLGTINSVVLTAEYMKQKNLPLKGIIFNNFKKGDVMHEDNLRMCELRTGLRVLDCVEHGARNLNIAAEDLAALYE